jgi:aspartyl-tRNA(Asn)/glutamyl-tRNA(Gln) amidotransferase subunit A
LELELKGNFDEYFSAVRENGFGEEAKRRIILGTFARMAGFRDAYYLKALKVRTKIIQEFKLAFKKFDVLIAPTMPIVAPRFEEIERLEPIEQYMMDILTVAPNLAGIPHISIPCGFLNGLPVGMHIMADHFQEKNVLRVAHTFEKVRK